MHFLYIEMSQNAMGHLKSEWAIVSMSRPFANTDNLEIDAWVDHEMDAWVNLNIKVGDFNQSWLEGRAIGGLTMYSLQYWKNPLYRLQDL